MRPLLPLLMVAGLVAGVTGCAALDPYDSRKAELSEGAKDCGQLTAGRGCTDEGGEAARCLTDAWSTCTRATLETTRSTVEGDPIVELLVVTPGDDGCQVVMVRDTRADAFGPREVSETVCGQLVASEPEQSCPAVGVDECAPH